MYLRMKSYEAPQFEVLEIELENAILNLSNESFTEGEIIG